MFDTHGAKVLALAAAVLITTASASAIASTDLIVNGGFETGDTTGWTKVGNNSTPWNNVATGNSYSGTYHYAVGNYASQGVAGLAQTFDTDRNADYSVSLAWADFASNLPGNQLFSVRWNDHLIGQISESVASTTWSQLSYTVKGTGRDTLTIEGFSESGYNRFDDVSVMRVAAAVPEPETYAMLLAGLGLIGASVKRRKAKQA